MKFTVSTTLRLPPNLPPGLHGNLVTVKKTLPFIPAIRFAIGLVAAICLSTVSISAQARITVAILDLGDTVTGAKAAAALRHDLQASANLSIIDQSLAAAAARGNGYEGSLNLTTQEARDL